MTDRRIGEPGGSPHDIAMMAWEIAKRAMEQYDRHEKDCTHRWKNHDMAMAGLSRSAEANAATSSADRKELNEKIDRLHSKATSIVTRVVIWLMSSMAAGLAGAIWFIITQMKH